MITTTYRCDRCGTEQADSYSKPVQFWNVHLSFSHGDREDWKTGAGSALWCRFCMEQAGLLPLVKKDATEHRPASPCLEDIIREIVRTEIAQ